MAQAWNVAMIASPVCSYSSLSSFPPQRVCRFRGTVNKSGIVACQHGSDQEATPEVSRRSFALVGAAGVAGLVFLNQPEAQAKRKPPPPQEKKPEEDPNLSAYDAKLLASARRKEALKAKLEKQIADSR